MHSDKYTFIKQIGRGAFGNVYLAKCPQGYVAVKQTNKTSDAEFNCLTRIGSQENVVKLLDAYQTINHLNLVMEWCNGGDLAGFIKDLKFGKLDIQVDLGMKSLEDVSKGIITQITHGLSFIHNQGYFHRDLKPENVLLQFEDSKTPLIKIADFGLARTHPSNRPVTSYISTRWYRAPEILLRAPTYDPMVDVWALGCIMAELYNLEPLFPGNDETHQVDLISRLIGLPDEQGIGGYWIEGVQLAERLNIRFSGRMEAPKNPLPLASLSAHDFFWQCIQWDPMRRTKAERLLYSEWIGWGGYIDEESLSCPSSTPKSFLLSEHVSTPSKSTPSKLDFNSPRKLQPFTPSPLTSLTFPQPLQLKQYGQLKPFIPAQESFYGRRRY